MEAATEAPDISGFGWWPGGYLHRHCSDCDKEFMGGKRAVRCQDCATAAMQRWSDKRQARPAQPTETALERIRRKVAGRTDLHDRDSAGAIGIKMGDLRALLTEIEQ
jgi:hypothetical protein